MPVSTKQPLSNKVTSGKVIAVGFCAPHSALGRGLPGRPWGQSGEWSGSQAEGCPGQAGRTDALHSGINDLFLNFLITRGEMCPFKVTDSPDHLEKMRSIRRAFTKPMPGRHSDSALGGTKTRNLV